MKNNEKEKTAVSTSTGKSAYFIGNGINRLPGDGENFYEWGNLLQDVNEEFTNGMINNIRRKPFPLVYDEIVNYAVTHNHNITENNIKNFIRNRLDLLQPNPRYDNLRNLNCEDILTTNYEYLIERSFMHNWQRAPVRMDERSTSIYRNQTSAGKTIWHTHGEQADIRSILLGFRHYLNYFSRIKEVAENSIYRFKNNIVPQENSWIDLFFTHNINILGFGFDYNEYHLWWLLSYRFYRNLTDKGISINNEINYYLPAFNLDNNVDRIDSLRSVGVRIIEVNVEPNDWDSYYERVFNDDL